MKIHRALFLPLIILNLLGLVAQNKTNQEFGFVSDNDLYVSTTLDEYYTNGIELFYKKVSPTNLGLFTKKINHFRLGQKMYNPFKSDVEFVINQDRPYAGYLYARYSQQFINDKNILKIGLEAGFTGDKTKAREAQNFIHRLYTINESDGWDSQVKEKYNFGLHLDYTRSLFHKTESALQVSWLNQLNLNAIFTNISSGIALKLNTKIKETTSIANTSFFGTSLQTENESWVKECYWGLKSYTTYQFKDATVSGELQKNIFQKQFHIQPWVWHNDIGYYWNLKKWNFSYHQIFHTRNTKEITKKWIRYGSIQLSYKF